MTPRGAPDSWTGTTCMWRMAGPPAAHQDGLENPRAFTVSTKAVANRASWDTMNVTDIQTMPQITARLSERLLREIDKAARRLKRTRADVIRTALEYYLEDLEDLTLALKALQDPSDPVLDWAEVRRDLLGTD